MRIFPGLPLYGALAVFLIVDLVWLAAAGIGVDISGALPSLWATAAVAAAAAALRLLQSGPGGGIEWRGETVVRAAMVERAATTSEAFFFLLAAWNVLRVFNHLTMTTGWAYADPLLAAWDGALGLDWNAYFAFVAARPMLIETLAWSYVSLTPVSAAALLALLLMGRVRAAEYFVFAFFATAIICSSIGMFFPAEAAVVHLLDQPHLLPAFGIDPGVYHMAHMHQLRGADPIVLDLANLPGLVTFPSFHTAAGIVATWCFRRTALFAPVLAYTTVMIASTPVFGGHYFVDLIAGGAVALGVLITVGLLPRYRTVFARVLPVGIKPKAVAA